MQGILAWLLAFLLAFGSSTDKVAETLVSGGFGVDSIESWTLNIHTVEYFDGEPLITDYLFEQSPTMYHLVTYPELAVADGDYDKFYDIAEGMLYSTGVGGWFAMQNERYICRFENLIHTDISELIENPVLLDDPETLKRYDCYVVSGTTNHQIVDELSWFMYSDAMSDEVERLVSLAYDTHTLELKYIQFMLDNGERQLEVSIEISNVNSTVVELPFDPATIRHAY